MGKAFPFILSSTTLIVVENRRSHATAGATGPVVSDMRSRSKPMEVTVHTQYDQFPMSQMSRFVSTKLQGQYKDDAHNMTLDADVESSPEK